MNYICISCPNNYAYTQICEPQCPSNTYPYTQYKEGGKSCLACSLKVHEILNNESTGCNCMEGYIYNEYA
jgi:hypothetical protein